MKSLFRKVLFIIAVLPISVVLRPSSPEAFTFRADTLEILSEQFDEAGVDSIKEAGRDTEWSLEELDKVLRSETGASGRSASGWKNKKNSRVAMLCALLFPGLGQMYNEKPLKAAIAMGLETYYLNNILRNYRMEEKERKKRDQYEKFIEAPETGDTYLNSDWIYHNSWYEEYKARKIDWVWWSAGLMVVLIFDAYVDAHLHDMNFRVESIGESGATGVTFNMSF